jgi:hypothetical protein
VKRAGFQKLAEMRLEDAKILLDQGKWPAAYYLAGYSVECALKACIIAFLNRSDEWPEPGFSNRCYTHSLDALVGLARLLDEREALGKNDAIFANNWVIVKDWTEEARYRFDTAESDAKRLYDAIAEADHGVLAWLKKHW